MTQTAKTTTWYEMYRGHNITVAPIEVIRSTPHYVWLSWSFGKSGERRVSRTTIDHTLYKTELEAVEEAVSILVIRLGRAADALAKAHKNKEAMLDRQWDLK